MIRCLQILNLLLLLLVSSARCQDSSKILLDQGTAEIASGRYSDAIPLLARAIRLDPTFEDAFLFRANAYVGLRDSEMAFRDFASAMELNPTDYRIFDRRGYAYDVWNNSVDAMWEYTKAIELKPDHADAYFNRGLDCFRIEDFHNAILDFTKAIELTPDNADAYTNRGSAYARTKDLANAVLDFSKAIELKPDHALAVVNRAAAYMELEQYSAAIEDYSTAITIDTNQARAYFLRGRANARLKNYQNAIRDFDKAIELKPAFDDARTGRRDAYDLMRQGEKISLRSLTADLPTISGIVLMAFSSASFYLIRRLPRNRFAVVDYLNAWREGFGATTAILMFLLPLLIVGITLIAPARAWLHSIADGWKIAFPIPIVAYLQYVRVKKSITRLGLPPLIRGAGITIFVPMVFYCGYMVFILTL